MIGGCHSDSIPPGSTAHLVVIGDITSNKIMMIIIATVITMSSATITIGIIIKIMIIKFDKLSKILTMMIVITIMIMKLSNM